MPGLLRVDFSLCRDESIFLRKATEYIGQNNVTHRQMDSLKKNGPKV